MIGLGESRGRLGSGRLEMVGWVSFCAFFLRIFCAFLCGKVTSNVTKTQMASFSN